MQQLYDVHTADEIQESSGLFRIGQKLCELEERSLSGAAKRCVRALQLGRIEIENLDSKKESVDVFCSHLAIFTTEGNPDKHHGSRLSRCFVVGLDGRFKLLRMLGENWQ